MKKINIFSVKTTSGFTQYYLDDTLAKVKHPKSIINKNLGLLLDDQYFLLKEVDVVQDVVQVSLEKAKQELSSVRFKLTDDEKKAIEVFVKNGGSL